MSSVSAGTSVMGNQRPRLESIPSAGSLSDAGKKAADLASLAGLDLDDWQRYVIDQALRRQPNGLWAAFEVAVIVSRQNGKGGILEARELAGLFLDDRDGFGDERLILHSAHEFKTASEAFRRVLALIQDTRALSKQVTHVYLQRGQESIELKNGKRLRFVARSSGSGRGFSGDLVILDEAQVLGDEAMAALLPTLSARPNPQVLYTGSAGNEQSVQLGRVRERGMAGSDPSLAFFEWSVDENDYDPADLAGWVIANPGLGIRITPEYVERERAALAPGAFARERLGVGLYPTDVGDAWQVIPKATWASLEDRRSLPEDPVTFAIDSMPGGSHTAIGCAGLRADGLAHVEVVDYRPGIGWAVPRMVELWLKHSPLPVIVDPSGHAGSLIPALEAEGVEVAQMTTRDAAQACGQFLERVIDSGTLRHRGDLPLASALGGAATRLLADAWAWDRKTPATDICPLVSVTEALWGHMQNAPLTDAGVWVL